MEKYK